MGCLYLLFERKITKKMEGKKSQNRILKRYHAGTMDRQADLVSLVSFETNKHLYIDDDDGNVVLK